MKQAYTNTIRKNASSSRPLTIATSGKKNKLMPKCSYGSACRRKDCVYRHPDTNDYDHLDYSKICLPYLASTCPYGKKCRNRHPSSEEANAVRAQYKQRYCSYGDSCRTEGCLYLHSWEEQEQFICQKAEKSLNLTENTHEFYNNNTNQIPTYDQWIRWGCPLHPNNNPSISKDDADLWYHPSGTQRAAEEVYNLLFFPNHVSQYNNYEQQEEYIPADWMEWKQMGCPIPQSYYDNFPNNSDPWYTDDGVRKTYEEVFETLYHSSNTDTTKQHRNSNTNISAPPTGWAAIAAKNTTTDINTKSNRDSKQQFQPNAQKKYVKIPKEVWLSDTSNSDYFYTYPDPMERYYAVNKYHLSHSPLIPPTICTKSSADVTVMDLHYQSSSTASIVLDEILGQQNFYTHDEIWVITGSGHHTGLDNNHQKRSDDKGGFLFQTVLKYLTQNHYEFFIGKDNQGNSGCFLVLGEKSTTNYTT